MFQWESCYISVSDVHNVSALFQRCWIFFIWQMSCLKMAGHTSVKDDGRVMLHALNRKRESVLQFYLLVFVCCQHVDRFFINLSAQRVWRVLFFQNGMKWGLLCVWICIFVCLSRAVCNSSSFALLRSTKMKPICFLPWVLIYCRALYITQTPNNTLK